MEVLGHVITERGVMTNNINQYDENQNNQWDDGEDYIDSRKLMIKISDQIGNEFIDYGLRTGTQYFYNIVIFRLHIHAYAVVVSNLHVNQA